MKHGTIYAYNRCGCRCDLCKMARRDYMKQSLADPRVREAHNRKKARQQRVDSAARRWLAEHQPEVLSQIEMEVA